MVLRPRMNHEDYVNIPSPLTGEGEGGGGNWRTPHLNPPPQGGRKIIFYLW